MTPSFTRYNILKTFALIFTLISIAAFVAFFVVLFTAEDPEVAGPRAFALFGVAFASQIIGTALFYYTKRRFKRGTLHDYLDNSIEHAVYRPRRNPPEIEKHPFKRLFSSKNQQKGLFLNEIGASQFVPLGNDNRTYDFIEGKIESVKFISSDLWSRERTSNDGKSSVRTLFRGRVIIFDFNKPIKGHVLALDKFKPYSKGLAKVDTESIEFNKTFNTYASDAQLLFYILTPQMIEALMELERNHPGRIGFSFVGRKLYVALNLGRDTLYLPKIRFINANYLETIKKDFDIFHSMVQAMRLDDDLFMDEDDAEDESMEDDYTMAETYNPKTAAQKIAGVMDFNPPSDTSPKTLTHNDESQRLYDFATKNMKASDKKQFDQRLEHLIRLRLFKTTDTGEEKPLSKGLGCLLVAASIAIIILIALIVSCVAGG